MQILFCDTQLSIRIVYYLKVIINVIHFLIPLGLIIKVSLDLYKGVLSGSDNKGEILTKTRNRIIAAIIIFLVPTLVGALLSIFNDFGNTNSYKDSFYSCYMEASPELIESIENNNNN